MKTFLVVVRLSTDDHNSIEDRISSATPKINKALADLAGGEARPFIRSKDGSVCTWLLRADCRTRDVYSEIHNSGSSERGRRYTVDAPDPALTGDALRTDDQVAVFEIGNEAHAQILNQDVVRTWLGRSISS